MSAVPTSRQLSSSVSSSTSAGGAVARRDATEPFEPDSIHVCAQNFSVVPAFQLANINEGSRLLRERVGRSRPSSVESRGTDAYANHDADPNNALPTLPPKIATPGRDADSAPHAPLVPPGTPGRVRQL